MSAEVRRFYWAVAVLFLVAILTRLWGLGDWPLDHDELNTVMKGHERLWSLDNPSYYWLWAGSTKLLGLSEFSSRLPSALFGIAAIPLFALTWRNYVGDRAAILGAVVVLLSGWHLQHSQLARFYACVFLFASLCYYLYLRALESDSWKLLLASLLAGAVATSFHASAAAVPTSCFIATIVLWLFGKRLGVTGPGPRLLRTHLVVAALGALVATPIAIDILGGWSEHGMPPPGGALFVMRFAKSVEIPMLLLAAAGWLMLLGSHRLLAMFIGVAVAVPLGLAIAGSEFIGMRNDYLFYLLPLFAIAAGTFLDQATRSLGGVTRIAATGALTLLLAPTFVSYYLGHMTLDVRDVVAYVQSRAQPDDQVLPVSGEFRYYAPKSMSLIDIEGLRNRTLRGSNEPEAGWPAVLQPILDYSGRTWIVIRQTRTPKDREFTNWLGINSHLVWRRYAVRLDEEVDGFEVWLVDPMKH